MKTSESVANIAKALVEAQKKINHAQKDSKNPHFKNDYASLESVIDATKTPLLEQGIFVIQSVGLDNTLTTTLQHSSGEFFQSSMQLLTSKNDMQGLGSSITYGRRYQLASMLNISQADDDANLASQPQKQAQQRQYSAPPPLDTTEKIDDIFNDSGSFETYIINAGPKSKLTGTKLKDHTPKFLLSTVESSEKWHKENNKTPHKNTQEFISTVYAYLKSINEIPF